MAGVGNLDVGHDYAPGAEPGPLEALIESLLRLLASPAALSLLAFAIVAMTGWVLHRRYIGRLAPPLPTQGAAASTAAETRKTALAELRRRRAGTEAEPDPQPDQPD